MGDLYKIMRFSLPYLRRYWLRFTLGIICGFIFGLSNGFTVGGVYLMLNRLDDPAHVARVEEEGRKVAQERAAHESVAMHTLHEKFKNLNERLYLAVDPWLPLANRPLNWQEILGGLLLIPLLTAFRGLMGYSTSYLMAWASQRIANDVKEDIFRKISSMSLDFFHRSTTAELMSRINDDTGALNSCLKLGLSDLIKEPSTIVTLFIWLLIIDWKLTLIAMAFTPMCLIPTRMISRKIKSQGRQDNLAMISQSGIAMESFQNVRVTKAYELAGEHARLFRRAGDRAGHFVMKTVQARATLNPILETINGFGISAVLLYTVWAHVTFGVLWSFILTLILFLTPIRKLGSLGVYFTQASLAMERLMAIFKQAPSVREPEHPVALAPFRKALEFRDVSFSYGDGPVLERISFTLQRGQRLGLAGESGSGKSSLINLLFRFYDPTEGQIMIDGTRIEAVAVADLRLQLALVSQDILLFNTTVAENIAFGKIGASREEIIVAAKEAYAHEFIESLPQGYDTQLRERGLRLSGGQRQRIAIARAFVRNAPILVLDEATASLDSQSEAEVQKAIDHLAENRTVICVAHRLSTLRSMDEILVLQRGQVIERGRFEELLARQGAFAAMASRQSISPQVAA
jgi:ABC-type multidrug transport system fused ATPase/permease subunit